MRRCAEHLFPLPFLPGMAATFADYLGMAMLTPALPYWCADEAGMTPAQVATWTGAITTAQYAGAAMGNFAVGAAGDGLGAKRTLLATLLGDVVLFTLTAVETRPGALLAIRLVAGASSPLVAALMYILQRAEDKAQTLAGVNAYSLSVNCGYALGGVVVGLAYRTMGWLGLNLLSACVAGAALVFVAVVAKRDSLAITESGARRREEAEAGVGVGAGMSPRASFAVGEAGEGGGGGGGLGGNRGVDTAGDTAGETASTQLANKVSVFRTGAMVSHCYTAFNTGYLFMGFIVLFVLMAKQVLGWSVVRVGWAFMAIPVANVVAMYGLIPPFVQRFGVHCSITCASIGTVIVLAVLALPSVHRTQEGILTVTFFLILCVVLLQVPNQMRIKIIADAHAAPGAMGRITGASRVCFATGQTCSPIVVALLYVQDPTWAVLSMVFVAAAVPAVFVACGQALWADPDSHSAGRGGDGSGRGVPGASVRR